MDIELIRAKLIKQLKMGEPYSGAKKGKGVIGGGYGARGYKATGKNGKKAAAQNPWIKHVKAVAKANGLTYGEALRVSSASYKK